MIRITTTPGSLPPVLAGLAEAAAPAEHGQDTTPTGYDELVQVLHDLPVIIRETRRRKRLSQRAAAEEMGVSFTSLGRWERGEDVGSLAIVIKILRWAAT